MLTRTILYTIKKLSKLCDFNDFNRCMSVRISNDPYQATLIFVDINLTCLIRQSETNFTQSLNRSHCELDHKLISIEIN